MIDRDRVERLREHWAMEVSGEEIAELLRVYLAWLDAPLHGLYDAASKGFHTSESCGPEGKYQHVSKFKTLQDLQDYHKAWVAAMVSVRDANGWTANDN